MSNSGIPSRPSPRTKHVLTADMNDVDGIKTSVASSIVAVQYVVDDLNGAQIRGGAGKSGALEPVPRTVTVTTSASPATYNTVDPIVVTGMRGSQIVTEDLTLTNAGGGETIRGTKAFDRILSIDIPAQSGAGGAFEFGVGDLCSQDGDILCVRFRPTATGFVRCRFDESDTARDDSIPTIANQVEHVAPKRILTDAALTNPTDSPVVLYF